MCIHHNLQDYTLKRVIFTVYKLYFVKKNESRGKKKTVSWDIISVRLLGEFISGEGAN